MTNYTILPNNDITLNISDGAFRLYCLLNSMCYGEKDSCFPGQSYLAQKLNRSIRTIQRYMIELVKAKMIKIKRRGCFLQVKFQAFRNLIFQAPHPHYWEFMVECVSL